MNTGYDCTGDCCERFFLPFTPEELWAKYEQSLIEKKSVIEDIFKIAPMAIPVDRARKDGLWYTCKHWNKETRLCRIYDVRPQMCIGYPYGKECKHCKSTCGTEKVEKEVLPAGPVNIDDLFMKRRTR